MQRGSARLRQQVERAGGDRAVGAEAGAVALERHDRRACAEAQIRLRAGDEARAVARQQFQVCAVADTGTDRGEPRAQQAERVELAQRTLAARRARAVLHAGAGERGQLRGVSGTGELRQVHGDAGVELIRHAPHAQQQRLAQAAHRERREIQTDA